MDIKKIIEGLKGENELILFNPSTGETGTPEQLNETDRTFYDVHIEAAKALEKQVPKKAQFLHMLGAKTYKAKCPMCGRIFTANISLKDNPKFCCECGQAIDWSEDESEGEK